MKKFSFKQMSIRLRKSTPDVNSSVSASSTTVTETVTEVTKTDLSPTVESLGVPMKESKHFMTRNYLWAYLLFAVIVMVVIFWYAVSGCRADDFDRLHCKGVEWIKGSSGRTIMGLFLIIALLLVAWACSSVSGIYRCMGDMNKCNGVMGIFGLMMVLVLITFILFYRGSFTKAYYFALFTLLMALLVTIMFAYYKFSAAACAMGLFTLWAVLAAWVIHKVSCQNPCRRGRGGSGSGSGSKGSPREGYSPSSSPHGSPHH
jgi:magnesium-transporting ATPase (P-type)